MQTFADINYRRTMDIIKINMMMETIDRTLRDPSKPWDRPLGWSEERTGLSRFKLLLILVLTMSCLLLLGYGTITALFSNVIGFAFPAYSTVATMLTPRRPPAHTAAVPAAALKWLTYWPAFTAVMVVEHHLGFILRLIPYYLQFKALVLLWCFAPIKNNGVALLHKNIGPYIVKFYKYD